MQMFVRNKSQKKNTVRDFCERGALCLTNEVRLVQQQTDDVGKKEGAEEKKDPCIH